MVIKPLLLLLVAATATWSRFTRPHFRLPPFQHDPAHPYTIAVEGNVGAGKSTLLNFFSRYPEMAVHTEPLEIWQNLNGTDFLGLMIENPSRWGFTFESLVTLTMAEIHMADHKGVGTVYKPVKVMERSLQSAQGVFVRSMEQWLSLGEQAVLEGWYNLLVNRPEFDTKVDLTVYLRTTPEVAYQRMRSRAREEEATLPLEHFQILHQLHEDWLMGENKTVVHPVIVIDADEDLSTLQRTYRQLAKAVWKATN